MTTTTYPSRPSRSSRRTGAQPAAPGTVIEYVRDDSLRIPASAAFIAKARAEGRRVVTYTATTETRWVTDGPVEALSDHWLFEAWEKATTDADTAREQAARTEIRARGFILSIEDAYEDQIVYHDEHGWARVLEFSDEEHEAIEAGEPVESVWLYPENKPDHVPYDPNGYMVEVRFADLTRGQMRDGDGRSPQVAVVAR